MLRALVLLVCLVSAQAGRIADVDYLQELEALLKNGRFSDNIIEDANLDVPELVRKYNYPLEEHSVVTVDGYILGMHRIPHGRDNNNRPGNKPIIFLMHGLLGSSADYVLTGPGSGLAYILAEEGFDVWMGNARGNYYSRNHLRLRPDALFNTNFWEFSWDEIGNIDLPDMIDYALRNTGQRRLHYIGFSQGTTAFWVMATLRPEYNSKIISMHAMAPVAYMEHNKVLLFNILAPFSKSLTSIANLLGLGEFMPNREIYTVAGQTFCKDEAITQPICSSILFLIAGWNPSQLNTTMLPVVFGHTPAGSSVRQLAHYGQSIADKTFRRYDFGRKENRKRYNSATPPNYDLRKITAPVFLHYSASDPMAHVNDVSRLFAELGNVIGKFRVQQYTFSHLDFLYGIDARSFVYDRILNIIHSLES